MIALQWWNPNSGTCLEPLDGVTPPTRLRDIPQPFGVIPSPAALHKSPHRAEPLQQSAADLLPISACHRRLEFAHLGYYSLGQ